MPPQSFSRSLTLLDAIAQTAITEPDKSWPPSQTRKVLASLLGVLLDELTTIPVFLAAARGFGQLSDRRSKATYSVVNGIRRGLKKATARHALHPKALAAIEELQRSGRPCHLVHEAVLAREQGIDPGHLGRLIRNSGLSYGEWCGGLHMRHAIRPIATGSEQIKLIAYEIGLSGTTQLDRLCVRVFSMSPCELRQVARRIIFYLATRTARRSIVATSPARSVTLAAPTAAFSRNARRCQSRDPSPEIAARKYLARRKAADRIDAVAAGSRCPQAPKRGPEVLPLIRNRRKRDHRDTGAFRRRADDSAPNLGRRLVRHHDHDGRNSRRAEIKGQVPPGTTDTEQRTLLSCASSAD